MYLSRWITKRNIDTLYSQIVKVSRKNSNQASDFKPKEIKIPVPWGNLSAQVWGDDKAPIPVLCIHGWLDNSNTFAKILPYFKNSKEYKFVAVDMPGHGQSSHFPDGQLYQMLDMVFCVERIRRHFDWKQLNIFGHSFGAICGFLYTATNNKRVKKLIAIDAMTPFVLSSKMMMELIPTLINDNLQLEKKHLERIPPIFTYDEVIQKMMESNVSSVDEECCKLLMTRATVEVADGKYSFCHDIRLRHLPFMIWLNMNQVKHLAENIHCDVLLFKASHGVKYQNTKVIKRLGKWITSDKERVNTYLEVKISGNHYIHVDQAAEMYPHVDNFLKLSSNNE